MRAQRDGETKLLDCNEFYTFDFWVKPRKTISWRTPNSIFTDETKEPGFIGYFDFGWPIYSPFPCDAMNWSVAVNRLGPTPPYSPVPGLWKHFAKIHKKNPVFRFARVNALTKTKEILVHALLSLRKWGYDSKDFNQRTDTLYNASRTRHFISFLVGENSLAPSSYCFDTCRFLEATFLETTYELAWEMTKDMANRAKRLGDYRNLQTLFPADLESTTCFVKSDELLLDAKPRLIHNASSLIFWSNRSALQNFSRVLDARKFLAWSFGDRLVTLTYGGAMDPQEKTEWRNDVEQYIPSPEFRSTVHIIVGGDDILMVCAGWSQERKLLTEFEIELDISKCDQSQNDVTFAIFSAFSQCVYGYEDAWLLKSIKGNMESSTPFYKQHGMWLQTGQGETTCFNSGAVGGTAITCCLILDELTEEAVRFFFNAVGFDVKVSRMDKGCGTFHKGYWAHEVDRAPMWVWLPLPSRFVKFGWKGFSTLDASVNLIALQDHLAAVARGWKSMPLDPLFDAFVSKFCDQDTVAVRPQEFGAARAWKKWDWNRWARQGCYDCAKFYNMRYGLTWWRVEELIAEIHSWELAPRYVRNEILQIIYIRDYACDTQEDFAKFRQEFIGSSTPSADEADDAAQGDKLG